MHENNTEGCRAYAKITKARSIDIGVTVDGQTLG